MKTLYIVRGLPGSGKSTLAKTLGCYVFEADQYFVGADGVYTYEPSLIKNAHDNCRQRLEYAMVGQMESTAVANTFTRQWEMEPYRELARKYGYAVVELTVKVDLTDEQLAARNVHGVPVEVIAKMRARWEH